MTKRIHVSIYILHNFQHDFHYSLKGNTAATIYGLKNEGLIL